MRVAGSFGMLVLLTGAAWAQAPQGSAPAPAPAAASAAAAVVPRPAALVSDGVPEVPQALATATRPYMEFRTAGFSGWDRNDRSMLIATRFGDTAQLHKVRAPGADRRQISFEAEPIAGGSYARRTGDVLVVAMDVGGSEFDQLYTLKDGRLTLLTDGQSRNNLNAWTQDGRQVAFTSNKRNGTDSDIYMMDPRDPSTTRLVAEVSGGGWGVADFSPDGRTAIVGEYKSLPGRASMRSMSPVAGCGRSHPTRRSPGAGRAMRPTARCGRSATRDRTSSGWARWTWPPVASPP
ncbi:dipeptidyl aminopeptidase/acylaminoacyl peptidase [Sphingomonas jejuensis]|uniref:Dipeptidyl aminopeptidase/acylaminoacyl peptidase n=2 Tax=Sphingomonas jejuensis TaxID=904715 RepID=A0ABX0XND3_9SPHN|nr:dipeptidyl aminopeptidase/acylaminoacyl peptidase [Sphingomonas jejuensis]